MDTTSQATVLATGFLHTIRRERGLEPRVSVVVPQGGLTARDLAHEMELPADRIEGIFLNHHTTGLDALVHPGDRVAYIPYGTPASHPAFFGRFVSGE